MAKLNIKERHELPDLLNRLVSRTKGLANVPKDVPADIDRKAYAKLCKALHNLDAAVAIIFANQKARGKKFLSDQEIDKLFEDLKKEL